MKRSYGEIFSTSKGDEEEPKNKKQKLDLTVFRHLPAEILVDHIAPLIAYDWLYLSREWHQIARARLPSDQRIKFTRASLMAVVARNDIFGVKIHIDANRLTSKDLTEAFVFACSNSFDEIIDLLMKHPEVDTHCYDDLAINNAIVRRDYKLVKRFVKGNFVVNFAQLVAAIKHGNYNIVKLMLKTKLIDPSEKDNKALLKAASLGHYKIVKLLLKDPRVDPSKPLNMAISKAAAISYKITKLLLKDPRVDPSDNSNWTLKAAIDNAQYKTVKLLLKDPRVDPSDNSHELFFAPITRAVSTGNYMILKLLLKDPRSDPTVAANTMIRTAVDNDRADLVRLLLQHPRTEPVGPGGPESERLEHHAATAIDIAVMRQNLNMVQLILADPRVDFLFWAGYTIHRFIMWNSYEEAYTLLKDPRVVISPELFANISRSLQCQGMRTDLVPHYSDMLDLLELRREE